MPHPVDLHVGLQLKHLRLLHGMSQQKLGDALGLTFQQVQKYERGINRISASRLYQICAVLGVEPARLFEGLPSPVNRAILEITAPPDDSEMQEVRLFRRLPPEIRRRARSLLAALAAAEPEPAE